MIKRVLLAAAFSLGLAWGSAVMAAPMGDGFAQSELSAYLVNTSRLKPEQVSLVREAGLQGKQALKLTGDVSVQFVEVAVEPASRYTLSLRARYEGSESVEENPLFDQFLIAGGRHKVIPQREITFLDADRKRISGSWDAMPLRQWSTYRDEFYTPDNAAFIRLTLHSGIPEIVLLVDDLKLEQMDNSQSINVNPIVAQGGLHNYSGWSRVAPGGKNLMLDDGRIVFDTKYGSSGKRFPLSKPGSYVVHTVSTAAGYSPGIFLNFFNDEGKQLTTIRIAPGKRSTNFKLPEGSTHAQFSARSLLIEEIRLLPADK